VRDFVGPIAGEILRYGGKEELLGGCGIMAKSQTRERESL
jgi:hypothetical protein